MSFGRIENSVLLSTLLVGLIIVLSSFLWATGYAVERDGTMHIPSGFPLSFVSQEQSIFDYRHTVRHSFWALFDVVPATETQNARFVFNSVRVTVFGLSIFTWIRTDGSSVVTTIAMIPFVINVLIVQILLCAFYATSPTVRKYFKSLIIYIAIFSLVFGILALSGRYIYYVLRYQLIGQDARISNTPAMRMPVTPVSVTNMHPAPIGE